MITEKEYETIKNKLKPKITPEFLETLIECAKVIGWSTDLTEVQSFITQIYHLIGEDDYIIIDPYEEEL